MHRLILPLFVLLSFQSITLAQTNNTAEIENTNTITSNFFGANPVVQTNTPSPLILEDIRALQNRSALSTTFMFIRAIVGFIITFVGIYFVYVYLKKRSKKVSGANDIIKVLATTPVAPSRFISVVEIAGEMYLIAIADHNITLLSKIEDTETKDQILIRYSNSKENIVEDNFKTMFDKVIPSIMRPKNNEIDPLKTSKSIRERLEKLNPNRDNNKDNTDR